MCIRDRYNVASCSANAVEQGLINLADYDCVDLLLGLEKDDGHSLIYYKAFSPMLRTRISTYLASRRGSLLTSGAYVASDTQGGEERQWLADKLKTAWDGTNRDQFEEQMTGLGTSFSVYRRLNERHYAAWHPDAVRATGTAFGAMQYANGQVAAVAYNGNDYKTFTMSFPFECIKEQTKRNAIMKGILNFLLMDSTKK